MFGLQIPLSVRVAILAAILAYVIPLAVSPFRTMIIPEESDETLITSAFDMFQFHVEQPLVAGSVVFLITFLAIYFDRVLVRSKILPMA